LSRKWTSVSPWLEVIPRQLCDNSGFDATDVLNKLRQKHALPNSEGANFGVDVNSGGIIDTYEAGAYTRPLFSST